MFAAQARRTPDAIALVGIHRAFTYAELHTLTDLLAVELQDAGVRPESVVGCWSQDSVSTVVQVLSVLKAGGAYLLLDPHLPAERLRYMVDDTDPACILADVPAPIAIVGQRLVLATDMGVRDGADAGCRTPTAAVHPDDLAYVAYTSGSTGRPKGVLITHRAVANHSSAFRAQFDLRPDDRLPLMAPPAFDMATEEILPPLVSGCTLLDAAHRAPSMDQFTDDVLTSGYTILNIPAPLWHQWTTHLRVTNTPIPRSLRLVIVGSDKIYTSKLQEWKALPGADAVWWVAAYGVTEATVTSLLYLTAAQESLADVPLVPIGTPLRNVTAYVVRDDGELASPGELGELYLGGAGLARGYRNLPERTAERFVRDPCDPAPQSRCYRTGDLARMRADGSLVWMGRQDSQIKINGLRIEPAEIEARIQDFPSVAEAIVTFVAPVELGGTGRLIAYVEAHEHRDVDVAALSAFLAAHLHPLMVPDDVVVLERIPLNANGKIDRKALETLAMPKTS
jgi:amino acid adenylation domain-containing protein